MGKIKNISQHLGFLLHNIFHRCQEKRRQDKFQHRGFLLQNILQPSVGVYKI